jgi:hypothetical protein
MVHGKQLKSDTAKKGSVLQTLGNNLYTRILRRAIAFFAQDDLCLSTRQ